MKYLPLALILLGGCAPIPSHIAPQRTACVFGNAYDPSMHRWTLECLNHE